MQEATPSDNKATLSVVRKSLDPPPWRIVDATEYVLRTPPHMDSVVGGLFGQGDKCVIVGGSKGRKTFFSIDLALHLAIGRDWLGFTIPKRRRVLIVQYEIREGWYHRRIHRAARAIGLDPSGLTPDALRIVSLRGVPGLCGDIEKPVPEILPEELLRSAAQVDVIVLDPLYKILALLGADENSATDVGRVLAGIDYLAERARAAIVVVHHATKGRPGDKAAIDRGSGSGVLARDYDASLALAPHATEQDAVVVEPITRNYPPMRPFTAIWYENGRLERNDQLAPIVQTSRTAPKAEPLESLVDAAVALVPSGAPMQVGDFRERLVERGVVTNKARAKALTDHVVESGRLHRWRTKEAPPRHMIGLREDCELATAFEEENRDPAPVQSCRRNRGPDWTGVG